MKRKKIVMVGGGSNAWAPNIIKDMLLTESIKDSEFVLYDINKKASDLTRDFLTELNTRHLHAPATFISTNDRRKAFRKADYIIITISTGGLKTMAQDLSIPEKYGIYHTVGDTSGPGGWARLLRNFEVFRKMALDINHLAPGAMILNYTNPMTTLTTVLSRICEGPVVGLCHGLFSNLEFFKQVYKLRDENEIAVKYAGVNHFFWITAAKAGSRDVMADLRRRIKHTSITKIIRASISDPMGFHSNCELATELFRTTGFMPYLGDRHTCEFIPGYITSRPNMKKYRIVRTSIKERQDGFNQRERRLRVMVSRLGGKGASDRNWIEKHMNEYLERSRETAADIIAAHSSGQSFIDVGNLPNIGQISNLPLGVVVETAMRVDRNGFTPLTFGPLPEPIHGLVAPWPIVFGMTVDACFRRDKEMALQALRLDPVCSHLNTQQVREMGERLMHAHAAYLPAFR
ncbi:MAG: hypothetical protein Q7J98_14375 [Kiritimatiellia bacterium]|nr:hypothetical protein [Kiritimatiellia bacterium]